MDLSIWCITYNHEKFIKQTLDGFLKQEIDASVEIVISDDASTDGTREILKQYAARFPEKIRLILHEKNIGMMRNFTSTLHECKGKYIALCEGDDYWTDSKKLKKQYDFLISNPDFSICAHRVLYLKGKVK